MSFKVELDWTTKAGLRAVVILIERKGCTVSDYVIPDEHYRCGYVAVPEGHAFYGKRYDCTIDDLVANASIDAETSDNKRGPIGTMLAASMEGYTSRLDCVINVHGSLTFGEGDTHGEYPVEHSGLTWFGFDAHHYGDNEWSQDEAYMVSECESLAAQLMQLDAALNKGGAL